MYRIFIEYFDTDPETGQLATERTRSLISGRTLELALIDPSIDLALNKAGKAEFTVPAQHPFYSKITPMTTNVEIIEYNEDIGEEYSIFFGRISKIIRGWNNEKKVTCEGAFAFFNDTIQRWKKYTTKGTESREKGTGTTLINFVRDVLERHNDQMTDESRKIQLGTMKICDLTKDPTSQDYVINTKKVYRLVNYDTTLDVLTDMCLESEGGYMFVHRDEDEETGIKTVYLDWITVLDTDINQPARFGLNLTDINQEFDPEDLYTVLLPLGADYDKYTQVVAKTDTPKDNPSENGWYILNEDGEYVTCGDTEAEEGITYYQKTERPTTIKSVNSNKDYLVDTNAANKYGWIMKVKRWDGISDKNSLKKKAQQWMATERFDKLVVNCDVADLHNLDHAYEPFLLGKVVSIISPPHGITEDNPIRLPISEIHYDLNTGKKQVTIGTQPQVTLSRITKTGKTKEVRMPDARYDFVDNDQL